MAEQTDNTTLLTPDGYNKITELLEHLKRDHRAEIRERMQNVQKAGGGEVSEDPEFEEIKKEQAMLESRIAHLENIVRTARVLDDSEISTDRVGIGSKVFVKNLRTNEKEQYTILSSMEADPENNKISDVCPVGRALMRAKKGDLVTADTPDGPMKYLISAIKK